jgi:ribonuclease P protein component
MLPKKFRLTSNKDIELVYKTGKPFLTKFFNFKFKKNGLKESRFCIIVSNKVDKRAVIKNRIKRQISEILRLNMNKIQKGYDISIVVKSNIIDKKTKKIICDYHEIEKNILYGLSL